MHFAVAFVTNAMNCALAYVAVIHSSWCSLFGFGVGRSLADVCNIFICSSCCLICCGVLFATCARQACDPFDCCFGGTHANSELHFLVDCVLCARPWLD